MFGTKESLEQRKRGKQVQVWVTELECGKLYKTAIRNIASKRDFNRFDNGQGNANQVEAAYAEFEDELANTLRAIDQDSVSLNTNTMSTLFTFFSILAARHPKRRKDFVGNVTLSWRKLAKNAQNVQEFDSLLKREGYEASGLFDETSFALLKGDEELEYDAEPDALVQREIELIPIAFDSLKARTWTIINAGDGSEFVTADDPFQLWPTSREKYEEGSATVSDENTIVFVPLTPTNGIIGEWGKSTAAVRCGAKQVAQFNRMMMKRDGKIISTSQHFRYLGSRNTICSSMQFVAMSR